MEGLLLDTADTPTESVFAQLQSITDIDQYGVMFEDSNGELVVARVWAIENGRYGLLLKDANDNDVAVWYTDGSYAVNVSLNAGDESGLPRYEQAYIEDFPLEFPATFTLGVDDAAIISPNPPTYVTLDASESGPRSISAEGGFVLGITGGFINGRIGTLTVSITGADNPGSHTFDLSLGATHPAAYNAAMNASGVTVVSAGDVLNRAFFVDHGWPDDDKMSFYIGVLGIGVGYVRGNITGKLNSP